MVNKNFIKLLIIFAFLAVNSSVYSYLSTNVIENNNVVEKIEFGEINWTDGILTVYGEAPLPEILKDDPLGLIEKDPDKYALNLPKARLRAKSLAYDDACKNFQNALLNLRIKNNFKIDNYITTSKNDFKFAFNDFIAHSLKPRYIYREKSIKVTLTISLFSKSGVVTVFTNDYTPELIPFFSEKVYNDFVKTLIKTNDLIPQAYSSVIIDATDQKEFIPGMFPSIYNESKKEIYSSRIVLKNKVIDHGPVVYIPDIKLIKKYNFIDSKTFIIKAVGTRDRTDLILPDEEVKQLFSKQATISNLQNCRVIIILRK